MNDNVLNDKRDMDEVPVDSPEVDSIEADIANDIESYYTQDIVPEENMAQVDGDEEIYSQHSENDEREKNDGVAEKEKVVDATEEQPQQEESEKALDEEHEKEQTDFEEGVNKWIDGTKRSKFVGFIAGIVAVAFRIIHVAISNLLFDGNDRLNIGKVFNQAARSTAERKAEKEIDAQKKDHARKGSEKTQEKNHARKGPEKTHKEGREEEQPETQHKEEMVEKQSGDSNIQNYFTEKNREIQNVTVNTIVYDEATIRQAAKLNIMLAAGGGQDENIYIKSSDSMLTYAMSKQEFLSGNATTLAKAMYKMNSLGNSLGNSLYSEYVANACNFMRSVSTLNPFLENNDQKAFYITDKNTKIILNSKGEFNTDSLFKEVSGDKNNINLEEIQDNNISAMEAFNRYDREIKHLENDHVEPEQKTEIISNEQYSERTGKDFVEEKEIADASEENERTEEEPNYEEKIIQQEDYGLGL